MRWLRFFRRQAADREQQRELESYLAETTDDLIARGLAPEQARHQARRKLGNPTQIREEVYRMNSIAWLDDLVRDTRLALRMIRKRPSFSIIALLSLALGIGGITAIFAVVNAILLRPLAYPQPERLAGVSVRIEIQGRVFDDTQLAPSFFTAARDHNRAFEHLGVWTNGAATVTSNGQPEPVASVVVTAGVLPALGVPAQLGRWFAEADDRPEAERTVVLMHGYWQRRFAGDAAIVGQTLLIDHLPHRVIGVMPARFGFLDRTADLLLTQRFASAGLRPDVFAFNGIGRLKPDVSIAMANADLARVWKGMTGDSGVQAMLRMLKLQPNLRPLRDDVVGDVGTVLWVLMGSLTLVLLLVCANVANLVLVRAQARQREFTVRAALGAGWGRIVRELLVESMTLGGIGGACGLALAWVALRVLVARGPAMLPRLNEISVDASVVGFTLACSVGASLLFGLASMRSSRGAIRAPSSMRAQRVLVVAQVAMAFVLLVASGLMIRTLLHIEAVQPGYAHPEQVETFRLTIPEALVAEPDRVLQLQAEILRRLAAIPGVQSTAYASGIALEKEHRSSAVIGVEGRSFAGGIPPTRVMKFISPDLFRTQGTRIVAGRDVSWDEVLQHRSSAIVSENMARELWGDASAALGKRISIGHNGPRHTVVGVVEDVRVDGAHEPAPPSVYFASSMEPAQQRSMSFAVRSPRAGTDSFHQEVTAVVRGVHPGLPVQNLRTMVDLERRSRARTSFALTLLTIAGLMALVLALVGVYGVLAYAVSQRRREIGIRLALGAQPPSIEWHFLRQGIVLYSVGGGIGLLAAIGFSRWIASLLFGVTALDTVTYVVAGVVILVASAAASYWPARQAARVDPMETLRHQ